MKKLLIILLLCSSCSSTFVVNGVEIKQRKKVNLVNDHTPFLIVAFVGGYIIAPMIIK